MRPRALTPDRQQLFTATRERLTDFVLARFEMLCALRDRMPLYQNVLATKFILRIAAFRRIPMRLNAEMIFEDRGVVTERAVNFLFGPNIEGAFAVLGLALLDQ